MDVAERISLSNATFYASYANHIQRYTFAEQYCSGQRVLDAGCGIGYGSAHLAMNAAASVVALDISDEALAEAKRLYRRDNLRFVQGDVEQLSEIPELGGPFDVVVNFENIKHLGNPMRFLDGAKQVLKSGGTLVISTPNGELTQRDELGRFKNQFHIKEFAENELREMLGQVFRSTEFFGQWKTTEWLARCDFEKRLLENLHELYDNPCARIWRGLRRLLGKKCAPAPQYTGEWTCFSRDFVIETLASPPFPWPPDVILAVCRS